MGKLIELDAAIAETWKDTGYSDPLNVMTAIRDRLEALPTVDAVPVVRCGECKYLMPDNHCTMFADDRIRPSSSDFCSAGERKDGDGNETD